MSSTQNTKRVVVQYSLCMYVEWVLPVAKVPTNKSNWKKQKNPFFCSEVLEIGGGGEKEIEFQSQPTINKKKGSPKLKEVYL